MVNNWDLCIIPVVNVNMAKVEKICTENPSLSPYDILKKMMNKVVHQDRNLEMILICLDTFDIEGQSFLKEFPDKMVILAGSIQKMVIVNPLEEIIAEPIMKISCITGSPYIDFISGIKILNTLKDGLEKLTNIYIP